MHSKFLRADAYSSKVIGAAIEVHRLKGAGLLESIYQKCLVHELSLRGIPSREQIAVAVEYKGLTFDDMLRVDVLVDDCLLVELKAVTQLLPIHTAQLFSYMRLLDAPLGLLINFHELKLVEGLRRIILPGADAPNH